MGQILPSSHWLRKFRQALEKYQAESGCGNKEISGLYKKFRKVLKTSTSESNLKVKIKSLNDEAFSNPLLKKRVAELEENATHYTAHKNPFMLAEGMTYGLSWIQTMNINNAFLFTEGAF